MSLRYEVTPGPGLVARHADSIVWVGEEVSAETWEAIGAVLDIEPGTASDGSDVIESLRDLEAVLRQHPRTVFAALIVHDGRAQGILRGPVVVRNATAVAPASGYEQFGITVPFPMSEPVYVGLQQGGGNPPQVAALLDLDAGIVPGGGAWTHPVSTGRRHSGTTGAHLVGAPTTGDVPAAPSTGSVPTAPTTGSVPAAPTAGSVPTGMGMAGAHAATGAVAGMGAAAAMAGATAVRPAGDGPTPNDESPSSESLATSPPGWETSPTEPPEHAPESEPAPEPEPASDAPTDGSSDEPIEAAELTGTEEAEPDGLERTARFDAESAAHEVDESAVIDERPEDAPDTAGEAEPFAAPAIAADETAAQSEPQLGTDPGQPEQDDSADLGWPSGSPDWPDPVSPGAAPMTGVATGLGYAAAQAGQPHPDEVQVDRPQADQPPADQPPPDVPPADMLPPVDGPTGGWPAPSDTGSAVPAEAGFQRVDLQSVEPHTGEPLPVISTDAGPQQPSFGALVFDDGSTFALDRDYVIGRRPEKDARVQSGQIQALTIVDPDSVLSGAHALISRHGETVLLEDLGSLNGSHIAPPGATDWTRLEPHRPMPIEPGTRLLFGWTVATYSGAAE